MYLCRLCASKFAPEGQFRPDAIKWRIDFRFTVCHNLWEVNLTG